MHSDKTASSGLHETSLRSHRNIGLQELCFVLPKLYRFLLILLESNDEAIVKSNSATSVYQSRQSIWCTNNRNSERLYSVLQASRGFVPKPYLEKESEGKTIGIKYVRVIIRNTACSVIVVTVNSLSMTLAKDENNLSHSASLQSNDMRFFVLFR